MEEGHLPSVGEHESVRGGASAGHSVEDGRVQGVEDGRIQKVQAGNNRRTKSRLRVCSKQINRTCSVQNSWGRRVGLGGGREDCFL